MRLEEDFHLPLNDTAKENVQGMAGIAEAIGEKYKDAWIDVKQRLHATKTELDTTRTQLEAAVAPL